MKVFGYLDDLINLVFSLPKSAQLVILGMAIVVGIWLYYKLWWRD